MHRASCQDLIKDFFFYYQERRRNTWENSLSREAHRPCPSHQSQMANALGSWAFPFSETTGAASSTRWAGPPAPVLMFWYLLATLRKTSPCSGASLWVYSTQAETRKQKEDVLGQQNEVTLVLTLQTNTAQECKFHRRGTCLGHLQL